MSTPVAASARSRRRAVMSIVNRFSTLILGVVVVLWLIVGGWLNHRYLHTDASACMKEAFFMSVPRLGPYIECEDALTQAIWSAANGVSGTDPIFPGGPQLLMWADNLFVDLYTLFFIMSAGLAYKKLTSVKSDPILLWRGAITATCVLALLGAIADHGENFWVLAYMRATPPEQSRPYLSELLFVAEWFSAMKFRFFVINVIVAIAWWVRVARRYDWERKHYDQLVLLRADVRTLRMRLDLPPDGTTWPDELSFDNLIVPHETTQIWLGIFFYHFLKVRANGTTWDYSFSIHAIRRWRAKIAFQTGEGSQATMYTEELNRFLNALASNGYLTPKGGRFEVTWTEFRQ